MYWLVNPNPNAVFKKIAITEDPSVPRDHALFFGEGGRKYLLNFVNGSITEIEPKPPREQDREPLVFKLEPSGPKVSSTQLIESAHMAAFHYMAIAVKTRELEAAFKRRIEAERDFNRIEQELETLKRDVPQMNYAVHDAFEGKLRR